MTQTTTFESQGYIFTGSTLVMAECPVCGIPYAMPQQMREWCAEQPHRNFYCPNGHQLHFPGPTEEEKLRKQLATANEHRGRLAAELAQTASSLRAQKSATTRIKSQRDLAIKKAHAGICPAPGCGRPFKDLGRHMKAKHPDYRGE